MGKNQYNDKVITFDTEPTHEEVKQLVSKHKDAKTRAWTFIIWEDSTDVEQFKVAIKSQSRLGVRALYIRHDRDVRANGEPKKVHWHIILIWDNSTTFNNALKTAQAVSNTKYIEPVRSLVGATRYLIHMDDPDKYQYDKDEVQTVGDVDFSELIESSRNDRIELKAMCEYIRDNGITHFDTFAYYCMNKNLEWFRILSERNTFFFKNLIQAQHFRLKTETENLGYVVKEINGQYIDLRTGEVLGEAEKK